MKAKVTDVRPGKCKIQLQPETPEQKAITDPDTFQLYYEHALASKYGPKARLMSVDEMEAGFEVTANYIFEGNGVGNV